MRRQKRPGPQRRDRDVERRAILCVPDEHRGLETTVAPAARTKESLQRSQATPNSDPDSEISFLQRPRLANDFAPDRRVTVIVKQYCAALICIRTTQILCYISLANTGEWMASLIFGGCCRCGRPLARDTIYMARIQTQQCSGIGADHPTICSSGNAFHLSNWYSLLLWASQAAACRSASTCRAHAAIA